MRVSWLRTGMGLGLLAAVVSAEVPLEEKIGQILMTGFRGDSLHAGSPVVRDLAEYHLGGVILFDEDVALGIPQRNIRSPEQLAQLTASLKSCSARPLLIAIDQEGGRVNRLKESLGFPPTVSHQSLGGQDDPARTYQESARLAGALKQAGINLNLAPVVNLHVTPGNFIAAKERIFSEDPSVVIRHAEQYILAHHHAGLICNDFFVNQDSGGDDRCKQDNAVFDKGTCCAGRQMRVKKAGNVQNRFVIGSLLLVIGWGFVC